MLNVNRNTPVPNIQERCDILQRHTDKIGVPVDYDRVLEYFTHFRNEAYNLKMELHKGLGFEPNKTNMLKWIIQNGYTTGFEYTDTGAISLGASSVESFINTNKYGAEVNAYVKMFADAVSKHNLVGQLNTIIETYVPPKHYPGALETDDGRRLVLLKPKWAPQNTGRVGMTSPALMNLPRFMKDIIAPPKGWKLLRADSGQIEPKLINSLYIKDEQLMKLIVDYKDAYYGYIHYCTMPEEHIINKVMDFELKEIDAKLEGMRKQLKTFGNAVMYGSTSNRDNDPLKDAYIRRIGQHPNRLDAVRKIEEQIIRGDFVFYTYFGTPIDIRKGGMTTDKKRASLKPGTEEFLRAATNAAINNPIQGTAADLEAISLKTTDEYMLRNARNSWIAGFIHDEGIYCIHEDEFDRVYPDISQFTSYNIDGGLPVYNDPVVGRKRNNDIPYIY